MARHMISFNDGDMNIPDGEWEKVGEAAHAVMRETIACRCPQEVREIMQDPEQEELQSK